MVALAIDEPKVHHAHSVVWCIAGLFGYKRAVVVEAQKPGKQKPVKGLGVHEHAFAGRFDHKAIVAELIAVKVVISCVEKLSVKPAGQVTFGGVRLALSAALVTFVDLLGASFGAPIDVFEYAIDFLEPGIAVLGVG